MKTPRRLAVGIAVAGAATLAASFTATARPGDANHRQPVTVIHLEGIRVQFQPIDEPPTNAPNLGDGFISSEDLYRNGKKVGFVGAECTIVRQDPAQDATPATLTFQCLATFSLPRGTISIQGLVTGPVTAPLSQPATWAITGGTRRYSRARGEMRIALVAPTETRITLRIER